MFICFGLDRVMDKSWIEFANYYLPKISSEIMPFHVE